MKIGFGDDEQFEKLKVVEIYENHSQRILIIEPDPENFNNLFLVTDEERILKISDEGWNKAEVVKTVDVSHHDL